MSFVYNQWLVRGSRTGLVWDWIWISCEYGFGLLECHVRLRVWVWHLRLLCWRSPNNIDLHLGLCILLQVVSGLLCSHVGLEETRGWYGWGLEQFGFWWNSGEVWLGSWWGFRCCIKVDVDCGRFGWMCSWDYVRVEKDDKSETRWRLGKKWLAWLLDLRHLSSSITCN